MSNERTSELTETRIKMKVSYAMKHNKKCKLLNVAGYQKMAIAHQAVVHLPQGNQR